MTREFLETLQLAPEMAEVILQEHEKSLQRLQFDHTLEQAIGKAKGRNAKAICALLDMDTLRENPDTLEQALETLKKENGYLFEQALPPVYARRTGSEPQQTHTPTTLASALKERFEKRK